MQLGVLLLVSFVKMGFSLQWVDVVEVRFFGFNEISYKLSRMEQDGVEVRSRSSCILCRCSPDPCQYFATNSVGRCCIRRPVVLPTSIFSSSLFE